MITVAEILERKPGAAVHTIAPATSVLEAMQLMANNEIGAVLVVEGGALAGILTERDYARKVVLRKRTSGTTAAAEIMSAPVVEVSPAHTSEDCIRLMGEHRIRHLPVLQAGRIVGMVSMRDLIDEIIADRTLLVEELEQAVRERGMAARDRAN